MHLFSLFFINLHLFQIFLYLCGIINLNLFEMGYIKHHAIIVSGWRSEKIKEAREKAIEIFEKEFEKEPYEKPFGSNIVSPIISGLTNTQDSFFIAPDGSKEGWETSNYGDNARKKFLNWLQNEQDNYSEYVEIIFGGDDDRNEVIRCKNSDLREQ